MVVLGVGTQSLITVDRILAEEDVLHLGRGVMRGEKVMANGMVKREEVVEALPKIKYGKASGVDGLAVEFLKTGSDGVVDSLVRLYDMCMAPSRGA